MIDGKLKAVLVVLGILSIVLVLSQLGMALAIVNGAGTTIRKSHQHSGYLMVAVTLAYLVVSLVVFAGIPSKKRP